MRRAFVLSAALLILGSTAATAFESTNRIDRRQERQDWRIQHGIENGSLTKREAAKLHGEAHQIRRLEKMALEDGHLHPAEKDFLEYTLDKLGKRIYRAKHNDRYAYRAKERRHSKHRHKEHRQKEWSYYDRSLMEADRRVRRHKRIAEN